MIVKVSWNKREKLLEWELNRGSDFISIFPFSGSGISTPASITSNSGANYSQAGPSTEAAGTASQKRSYAETTAQAQRSGGNWSDPLSGRTMGGMENVPEGESDLESGDEEDEVENNETGQPPHKQPRRA